MGKVGKRESLRETERERESVCVQVIERVEEIERARDSVREREMES